MFIWLDTPDCCRGIISGHVRENIVNGTWHSNNGRALVHAAKAGLGIIQVPDFYAEESIVCGELTERLKSYRIESNHFWALYPKSHHVPRKAQMLVAYIRNKLS